MKMAKHQEDVYVEPISIGSIIDSNGDKKFYKGKGRKKDKNVDDWEDRKQDAYLRKLEEVHAKNNAS